jgi:hypothetical protein
MRLGAAKKARESAKSPDEFQTHPASILFSWTKIRQSITLKTAQAFGRARFAFWLCKIGMPSIAEHCLIDSKYVGLSFPMAI